MTERPIIFSAEMVRAILAGRKTQTRRVIKPQPPAEAKSVSRQLCSQQTPEFDGAWQWWAGKPLTPITKPLFCPYGAPGDTLWVRETWCLREPIAYPSVHYRADGEHVVLDDGDGFTAVNKDGSEKSPWRPSIHMPRWASRITLRITDVRVERVQDILEDDARAEGCDPVIHEDGAIDCGTRKTTFARLWSTINGDGAWEANPWVWVLSFERVKP